MDTSHYQPRKLPVQSRSRVTFQAILDATARILKTNGYNAITTNRIAEEAGVSIGTLYEFFGNKGAIFAELKRQCLRSRFEYSQSVFDDALECFPEDTCRLLVEAQIKGAIATSPLEGMLNRVVPPEVHIEQRRKDQEEVDEVTLKAYQRYPHRARRPRTKAAARLTKSDTEVYLQYSITNFPEELDDLYFSATVRIY